MLAHLLNVPKTPEDWAVWGYAHRDQHQEIRQAIQTRFGVVQTEYPLDPIDLSNIHGFLEWNQQTHNDMNGALNTQGSDLSEVDPKDLNQLQAWIWLHYQEHITAANILGTG